MGRVSDAKEKLMGAVMELIWTGSYGTTTIDQICERAGVKKGSFYYFFDSKAQLAAEALDSNWQCRQAELDRMFSVTVSPLERLQKYCDFSYKIQSEIKLKHGRVLGCPQFSLGSEVCNQECDLQKKIESMLQSKRKYIESAIRDAIAEGVIPKGSPTTLSQMVVAYYEGLLAQARIQNDVELLRSMAPGIFSLLGAKKAKPITT